MASDEPVASRTRSQTTASEPVAARTRQALGSAPEMSAFADVKDDKTLNEWLHEIAFVASTMSDPDEPQSFPSPERNGERRFAWSSRRCWTWVCGDM